MRIEEVWKDEGETERERKKERWKDEREGGKRNELKK